ncbi:MAG: PEGA domain-containing protein [Caldisericota bacterium]|nr:PEGA domain-containing protein [Caldisericota bacterium]
MDKRGKILLIIAFLIIVFIAIWFIVSLNANASGAITIDSYPKGADVYVDGVLRGATPLTISGLKLGMYEIEVKKEGYETEIFERKLDKNNLKQLIIANLSHTTFTLEITSYPTEAEVYVDGAKKGFTPIKLEDILYGKHFIEVRKENFTTWSKEIDVEEYKILQIDAELLAQYCAIDIVSDPEGAKVYLNNEEQGITPIKIKNIDPGKYKLSIKKDGYTPYEEEIETIKGETTNRKITLKKADTFLTIDSVPTGANLYINNVLVGTTPHTAIDIEPNIYEVRVEKDGYLPFSTTVEVEKGKEISLLFPLLKLPENNP